VSDFIPEYTANGAFSASGSGSLVFEAVPSAGLAAVLAPFYKGDTGPPGTAGGTGQCFTVELNSTQVTNKQVTLPTIPQSEVLLSIVNGTAQRQNVDFIVTSNVLSWVGLALELLVAAGDCFAISYN
jgi:hypothetical protein